MEKKILLIAVYITLAGSYVHAQYKKNSPPAPPAAPIDNLIAPPPPPPPPPAPAEYASAVIVNNNGYEVSVKKIKNTEMVLLEKDGTTQKIKRTTWNNKRKYYEKKYGQLPAPPPERITVVPFNPRKDEMQ